MCPGGWGADSGKFLIIFLIDIMVEIIMILMMVMMMVMVVWLLRRVSPTQQRPARKASFTSAPHRSSHLTFDDDDDDDDDENKNMPTSSLYLIIFLFGVLLWIAYYLEISCFEHCMIHGNDLFCTLYTIWKYSVLNIL